MITTTIKRKYLDEILLGRKTVEYKGDTDHWHRRLHKFIKKVQKAGQLKINFVCGREAYKFHVKNVSYIEREIFIDEIEYCAFYSISLGDRVPDNMIQRTLDPEDIGDMYYKAYLDGRVHDNPHLCFRWIFGCPNGRHCAQGKPCKAYTQREDEAIT